MTGHYKRESDIHAVVSGFESCRTGKDDFSHQSHLTVAVVYLRDSTFQQAMEKMRAGLFRFVSHHGVDHKKYNQTVTIFWLKVIQRHINGLSEDLSLLEVTNSVVEALGNSRLAFEYYSPALLNSEEARSSWVEPDLRAL